MSVIRPKPPEDPLEYEPRGIVAGPLANATAPPGRMLDVVAEALEPLRPGLLAGPGATLPDRLLADYNRACDAAAAGGRAASELFAILRVARLVRESVDRVLVAGGGTDAARAVCDACCHPRHAELSRGERGGRPRLTFLPSPLDNDGLQAILDLVAPAGGPRGDDLLDAWGIVAVDDGGADEATAGLLRVLLPALARGTAGHESGDRFVALVPAGSRVAGLAAAAGRRGDPVVPGDLGGFAVFSAAGLVPAAVAGVDVVRLLSGARAMLRRFGEAPPAANPVLRFAAAEIVARRGLGLDVAGLVSHAGQLRATCEWHDLLRRRPAEHRAAVRTAVLAGETRRDAVRLPAADGAAAGMTWQEWQAVVGGRDQGAAAAAGPAPAILLPRIDEHTLGQLMMLLLLALELRERGSEDRV